MRKFTFRLETVRRLREQEEQLVRGELAEAMRTRVAVELELVASRDAERDLYDYLRDGSPDVTQMAHVAQYGELHRRQIYHLGVKLQRHDKAIEGVRARLVEARRRREALDRLHDRRRDEHRRAMLAEEQRDLDEVAGMRHARAATAGLGGTAA